VLVVARAADGIVPQRAVRRLVEVLDNAPVVEVCPRGHLGVLTDRGTRTTTWRHIDDFLCGHGLTNLSRSDRPSWSFQPGGDLRPW
jgi:polyhydroxyalkanoate synthase subunit PhaC